MFDGSDGRIRGRKGQRLRKDRLAREPLCRHCLASGRTVLATTVDHIIALAFGGTDTDDNCQSLCDECHAVKTAIESAAHGGADNHPTWLRPSAMSLTIVCGPPCSGKTTYVEANRKDADIVIDIDAIARAIDPSYRHWEGMLRGDLMNKAIRTRNAMLGALANRRQGKAWFIVAAPAQEERDWWRERLGGEVVLLHPGVDECKRRAIVRDTPNAIAGIDEWERRSQLPWQRKLTKRDGGVDASGRPLSADHPWNRKG